MARRRRRASTPSQPLTPDSLFSVTIKQMVLGGIAIAAVASGYGVLMWTNADTRKDVGIIKETITTQTAQTSAAIKDQDEKRTQALKIQDERREAMAKQFLESNEKIAAKVGELNTLMAVQQNTQKNTSEALLEISKQLRVLSDRERK